jgi:hypothetical protein
MRTALFMLAILGSTLGSVGTLVEWRDHRANELAETLATYNLPENVLNPAQDSGEIDAPKSVREVLLITEQAAGSALSASQDFIRLTQLYSEAAERERDQGRRLELYCRAIAQLGRGIKRDPFNPRLLVNWANIRQILGSYDCELPFTQGSYKQTLELALTWAPSDMQIKYASAMVLLFGGEKEEAHKLMGEVLAYDPILPAAFRNFIFSQVTDETSYKDIVPPRFPQILTFSNYLLEHKAELSPELLLAINDELEASQKAAIQESSQSFQNRAIPLKLHLERLRGLRKVSANAQIRSLLDSALAELFIRKREKELGDYFARRSQLRRLSLIRAALPSDTRALKTPLVDWNVNQSLSFDDFYRSVGFFLPAGQTPEFIELRGGNKSSSINASVVKILVSEDNQAWLDVSAEGKSSVFNDGLNLLLVLQVPAEYHRYWKINYASGGREKSLTGELSSLLNVYGRSVREDRDQEKF